MLGLALLYSPGLKGIDLYLEVELQLDSYFECIYITWNFSVNEHSACLICLMQEKKNVLVCCKDMEEGGCNSVFSCTILKANGLH